MKRCFFFLFFLVCIVCLFSFSAFASSVDPDFDNFSLFGDSSRDFVRAPLPFSSYTISYYKANDAYHTQTFAAADVASHGRLDGNTFSDYHSYSSVRNVGVSSFLLSPTSVRGTYNSLFNLPGEGNYFICLGQSVDIAGSFGNPCADFFDPPAARCFFTDQSFTDLPGQVFYDGQYYWTVWGLHVSPAKSIDSISMDTTSFVSSFGFRDVVSTTADIKLNVIMDAYFVVDSSSEEFGNDLSSFISQFSELNYYHTIDSNKDRSRVRGNFFQNIRDGFESIINLLFDPVGDRLRAAADETGLVDSVVDLYEDSSSNVSSGLSLIGDLSDSLSDFDLSSASSASGMSQFQSIISGFWSNAVKSDIQLPSG